jgi:hypothetical protein
MRIAMPTMPETLSYAVLVSLAVDVLLAVVLAVRGNGLGVVLILAVAAATYWFVCRHLAALVSAGAAAGVGAVVLALATLAEIAGGHPYAAILFLIATGALGIAFVLLHQGAAPAEIRLAGVATITASPAAELLVMLARLRDAGILSTEEFAEKCDRIGL